MKNLSVKLSEIVAKACGKSDLELALDYLVGADLSSEEYKEYEDAKALINTHFLKPQIKSEIRKEVTKFQTNINVSPAEAACIEHYGFYSPQLTGLSYKDGKVHIKSNLTNYKIIIKYLYPGIKFSLFERKAYIGEETLSTEDYLKITDRLVQFLKGVNVNTKDVEKAVRLIWVENTFNPLADYFNNLPISNKSKHLDNWLTAICGVEDNQINRIIGRKWLISCVARAMTPGCYVEGSLIFFGKQAAGKTRFFKTINPKLDYYCGSNVDITNTQKATQTYQGKFIIEFGELSSLNKANLEDTKQYLTESYDTYVPKYENLPVSVPRMMVFGGSTNHPGILNDSTGNRRFWCVEVCNNMNIDLLINIKEELWSEAMQAFKNGESWILNETERDMLNISNEKFEADDPFTEYMSEQLNELNPENKIGCAKLMEIGKRYESKLHPQTLSKTMLKLGWSRSQFTSGSNKGNKCYQRPAKEAFDEDDS